MATSSKAKVSLKLLIDTKGQKVLFAEAGKDFVDFLINLLSLPVGTVAKLLSNQASTVVDMPWAESISGSALGLSNLYNSILNLDDSYLHPNKTKESLLNPNTPFSAARIPLLLPEGSPGAGPKKFYTCPGNYVYHPFIGDSTRGVCPSCSKKFSQEVLLHGAGDSEEKAVAAGEVGFVKGGVIYMVTDALVVKPVSPISCIGLMSKLNVKEMSALEVDVGMEELLKASLQTKTVLTSVFLEHKDA
ncbi:hypothetical protein RHGRI_027507 [Rhododendron griersonianum]|uniref:DUF674 domain-containing protein n=1 Tax=Rhododendron griersonianum TaxID=479676 RepID=A0AAV6IYQ2_9ERIC|nr:hypothetical protein RHGRI_027507 [Rhododendron griersonianum]